ncbi:unnamed protein product [Urochloa decumbens]|uniref:Uncharacterized protein n=1 Tax=Urochloa decumbens TaxID=240449 RepID=A0ABC8XQ33_9POAL
MAGCDGAKSSASKEEEACVEKKYGGIAPKKPLISKVWALHFITCTIGRYKKQASWQLCSFQLPRSCLLMQDHERAYFDSADWVLGKQAANSSTRAATESLKPKLERTPHHQLPPRKPTCASS